MWNITSVHTNISRYKDQIIDAGKAEKLRLVQDLLEVNAAAHAYAILRSLMQL